MQSILDREERQRREAEEDDVPLAKAKSRKRKSVALAATDDSHNPVYFTHYHTLSADLKVALLYLNTCWMLHDANIHATIAESQMRDTPASAYGVDDEDRRHWLFIHCEWGENRVHLYRETDSGGDDGCRWELLASSRDQLEVELAVLMVQTSANSRALVRRIQYEALEFMGQHNSSHATAHSVSRVTMTGSSHFLTHSFFSALHCCRLFSSDREGRLAERRQRRATRMDIDLHNIISADADEGGGGRARRARKQVNYAELDNGDVDRMADEEETAAVTAAREAVEKRKNSRDATGGRRGRLQGQSRQRQRQVDDEEEWTGSEAEQELYETAAAQPEQSPSTADSDERVKQHEEQLEAAGRNEMEAGAEHDQQPHERGVDDHDSETAPSDEHSSHQQPFEQSLSDSGTADMRNAHSGEATLERTAGEHSNDPEPQHSGFTSTSARDVSFVSHSNADANRNPA